MGSNIFEFRDRRDRIKAPVYNSKVLGCFLDRVWELQKICPIDKFIWLYQHKSFDYFVKKYQLKIKTGIIYTKDLK